jgi:hypothetical protein
MNVLIETAIRGNDQRKKGRRFPPSSVTRTT